MFRFSVCESTRKKVLFYISILFLIGVISPLFIISFYNFRSVDDYPYIQGIGQIWAQEHSLLKVLRGSFDYAYRSYFVQQGTFLGEWLTSFSIAVFSENHYYMGTFLALGGFVLTQSFLLMVLLCKGLGADLYDAGIVTCWCMIMQILLTPYPVEAYFWFCGAMLYTVFHAMALLLVSLLYIFCDIYGSQEKTTHRHFRTVVLQTAIILLSVFIGSGTYVSALTIFILYFLLICLMWYKKHAGKIFISVDAGIFLAVFLSNILAPGNTNRLIGADLEKSSAIKSILKSLYEAFRYCEDNLILPVFIVGIMLIPFLYHIVQRKNFRYPLPLLVSIVSFGVFAAQFVPCIYTLGILGPGRIQNIYRFNFYLLLYGNELYWLGWLHRRWNIVPRLQGSYLLTGWLAALVLLVFSLHEWGGSTITTASAIHSLYHNEAQQYMEENQERLEILQDDTITRAYLKPFTSKPYLLFFGDIQSDPDDWVNRVVADYYSKELVSFEEE